MTKGTDTMYKVLLFVLNKKETSPSIKKITFELLYLLNSHVIPNKIKYAKIK